MLAQVNVSYYNPQLVPEINKYVIWKYFLSFGIYTINYLFY